MIALELEAIINNHHIEVSNDRLPVNATRAKLIVMYEEEFSSDAQDASKKKSPRQPGTLRGTVLSMASDFKAPLDDFKEYME